MAELSECQYCNEPKPEVIDGICEECEQHYNYCSVCDEWLGDSVCRHLFWMEWGEWYGTGGEDSAEAMKDTKSSFFAMLAKVRLGDEIRQTIKAGKMGFSAIHFTGTIFGWDSLHCHLKDGSKYGGDYGRRFTDNLSETQEDKMSLGVAWLMGLANEETPKQNETTLSWIKEWEAVR